ncbi:Carbohydrate binding module (family 6) [Granulicella rosea]|uniref:Carbohydrate binding module (Family 6) n=1 Tax=Granulicella rosea TaxID=474952 RepID=A0A239MHZ4_9BACT|nr:family 16 glycosylhydrolase [Granulicella rosea]SNT42657.1 Carbohydrate binding module (family 6) [Granulicella rosea]
MYFAPRTNHTRPALPLLALALIVLSPAGIAQQQTSGWKLVWSDEFNGTLGAAPDASKWKFQTGAGAAVAGNDEAEVYCARESAPPCRADQPNAYLDGNGHLVLVAVRTGASITVGAKKVVSPVYTSARMTSVQSFRYGRMEASIRIPAAGKGVWPAFWALGQESGGVHWPAVGEIDVMEQWNPMPGAPDKIDGATIHGAVHGPVTPGSETGFLDQSADFVLPTLPSAGLHQYAVEWAPGEVDFYVDGSLYHRTSVGSMTGKELWEQDRGPFNLLLNLAMGGGFFGYPDATTGATPTMVVDYVRVYQPAEKLLGPGWSNADIGGPGEAGSAVLRDGVHTVAGGGAGISGRFDQFQFAYKPLAGDGEVTAHVIDQSSKVAQAKAGVMLREGRGAAAPYAMAFVSPDGSVHFRFRTTRGEIPGEVLYRGAAAWLKVGRVGDVFTGYVSADGKKWEAIGNAKLFVRHDLIAGMIATSRDNKAANTVRFDHLDVTPTDAAFDGEAAPLPGVVQAERFDTGGVGYTFSAEFGEAGPQIERIPDAAGTEASAGGYTLRGLKAGRYINYSVNVAREGDYTIFVRAASAGAGGTLHFNLDQKPLSKPFVLPDTGGEDQWREVKSPTVHLAAGQHTLALVTDTAGASGVLANIDLFAVRPQ